MKILCILIMAFLFCMQAQAQTTTNNSANALLSKPTDVLIITRALLATPVTEKSIPAEALKNGKVEFSTKQYYARKVLKTQGEVRLSVGEKQIFRAGEAILLESGFEVDSTTEFTAEIVAPGVVSKETIAASLQTTDSIDTTFPEDRMATKPESIKPSSVAEFSLFPNPVSERLYVRYQLTEEAPVVVTLLSITGAVIQTLRHSERQAAGAYEVALSVSNISVGMYLVSLEIGQLRFTQRIVVR